MNFIEFTKYLPKILNQQLPSVEAHLKMAPLERKVSMDPSYYLSEDPRLSAVMMLLYPKNNTAHLVLTKRNEYPGIHSAQISFPGGKAEPGDRDLAHTALRETFEEIGVAEEEIEVIMPFTQIYIPPSNFLVSPFLGLCYSEPAFKANTHEVAAIVELPVDVLLDDSVVVNVEMQTSYASRAVVPAFEFQDHIVWGATAMILSELKETLKSVLK